jgi:pimeloyl-[acyl-carrier protein] methyl ester esterase
MTRISAEVIRKRIEEILRVDETAALRQVWVPTLVLRATRDRVISRRVTRVILKHAPKARLVEFDAPHLLLQTRAAESAEVVITFLNALQ